MTSPVHLKGEPVGVGVQADINRLVQRITALGGLRHREAERFEVLQCFPLSGGDLAAFSVDNGVDQQRSGGRWAVILESN